MDLVAHFQDLVAQVPEIIQPLIVALAGAVPFVEGEGAAIIGIIAGLNPVVAIAAAAIGNFLCVLVLVLASSGARSAIVNRRRVHADKVAFAADDTHVPTTDDTINDVNDNYARSPPAAHTVHLHHARRRRGRQGARAVLAGPSHPRLVNAVRRRIELRNTQRRLTPQPADSEIHRR
jgi:hypothetical protein